MQLLAISWPPACPSADGASRDPFPASLWWPRRLQSAAPCKVLIISHHTEGEHVHMKALLTSVQSRRHPLPDLLHHGDPSGQSCPSVACAKHRALKRDGKRRDGKGLDGKGLVVPPPGRLRPPLHKTGARPDATRRASARSRSFTGPARGSYP